MPQKTQHKDSPMKKNTLKTIILTATTGLVAYLIGACIVTAQDAVAVADATDQAEFPIITRQPTDQATPVGSKTVFTAQAINGNVSYQWFRNGVPIEGQTNSTLVLENVGVDDVGYYAAEASNGEEVVPTRAA